MPAAKRARASRLSRWSQKKPVLWPPANWTRKRTPFSAMVTRGGIRSLATGRPWKSSASAIRSSTWTRKCLVPTRAAILSRIGPIRWYIPRLKISTERTSSEPVDDQAAEAVGLGVDQPAGVRHLVEAEEVAAERQGAVDPALPELGAGDVDAGREGGGG